MNSFYSHIAVVIFILIVVDIIHQMLLHLGTITTQPSNVTVCSGGDVGFTCEVDRNGNGDIGTDDVMWQQLRSDSISNISGSYPFSITTTISGDILTSTLTISDVRDTHNGLYHCVVPGGDVMSRNASLYAVAGE